jgi:predicted nucleotidyltransferase
MMPLSLAVHNRGRASVGERLVLYSAAMSRDEILARLRECEPALRARGIAHAALFGSAARGDNGPDSDIDIMLEFDPEAYPNLWDYVGIKEYVAGLFQGPVDVVDRAGLKHYVRPTALAEAVYAF